MKLYALPSLSSHTAVESDPWTLTSFKTPILSDKDSYRKWTTDPATNWWFLSGFEGSNPGRRVAVDNPPVRMRAVILDYDVPLTPETESAMTKRLSKSATKPTIIHRTFSGGVRLIYLFESPCQVDSRLAEGMLTHAIKTLSLNKLLPGLDTDCVGKPEQTFAFWPTDPDGGDGLTVDLANIVRDETVLAWKSAVLERMDFKGAGPTIDLNKVEEALRKKYSDFGTRWPGDFKVGSRGCRFWDPSADNNTAALVRENGITVFTMGESFKSWGSLLGQEFVNGFVENRFGAAVKGVYFDGANYWRRAGQMWGKFNEGSFRLDLISRGLSPEALKGETLSEMQRALHLVQKDQFIVGLAPSIYAGDTFYLSGAMWLNSATAQVCKPATTEGTFLKLSELLYSMFVGYDDVEGDDGEVTQVLSGEDDYEHFMCWLARAYKGALEGKPVLGQAAVLVGPPQGGKSYLAYKIIGGLLGDAASADDYLSGETRFTDDMFESGVAVVDDGTNHDSLGKLSKFTQRLKQLVARPQQTYNGKFKKAVKIEWRGRLVICANDDAVSLQSLPDLTVNSKDKINIYKIRMPLGGGAFPSDADLASELPHLAKSLLTMKHSNRFEIDHRFGVKAYQNEDISRRLVNETGCSGFLEVLELYFRMVPGNIERMTSTELKLQIDIATGGELRALSPDMIGRVLKALCQNHPQWLTGKLSGGLTRYWIDRRIVGDPEMVKIGGPAGKDVRRGV